MSNLGTPTTYLNAIVAAIGRHIGNRLVAENDNVFQGAKTTNSNSIPSSVTGVYRLLSASELTVKVCEILPRRLTKAHLDE